jgi:hypothetical protein
MPSIALGSSSFGLRCSPFDLGPSPGGSLGSSLRALRVRRQTNGRVPRDLRSPSERPVPMRGAWTAVACGATPCLSWDSPHGVPLLRCPSLASTPGDVAATVGRLVATPADSFRPRGFAPPRRLPPRSRSRACCIPVPEGVRSVSGSRRPLQRSEDRLVRCVRGFPVCAFTPLEEVPPPAAAPRRRGTLPLLSPLVVGPPRMTVSGAAR